MATRPCLRCSKLVPETAAFCRRCGHSLIQKSSPVTAVEASAPTAPLPLSPRARPFPLSVASWPGLIVTTAAGAIAAVLGLFAASLPPVESAPSDPGPPRVESLDTDAGSRQLARMSERLAEARGRLGAARERVASARERWDWRAKGEAPQLLSTDRADGPAASVPRA